MFTKVSRTLEALRSEMDAGDLVELVAEADALMASYGYYVEADDSYTYANALADFAADPLLEKQGSKKGRNVKKDSSFLDRLANAIKNVAYKAGEAWGKARANADKFNKNNDAIKRLFKQGRDDGYKGSTGKNPPKGTYDTPGAETAARQAKADAKAQAAADAEKAAKDAEKASAKAASKPKLKSAGKAKAGEKKAPAPKAAAVTGRPGQKMVFGTWRDVANKSA